MAAPIPAFSSVEYFIAATGDNMFIPGNCQAPTNSHDNPDNGHLKLNVKHNVKS